MTEAELIAAGLGLHPDLEVVVLDRAAHLYRPAAWGETEGEVHRPTEDDVRVMRCGLAIGSETFYLTELPLTCGGCITG